MKFFGVVPLFCVALFGYLSFTQQSNATWEEQKSAGKSVSTNQAATEHSFDDLKDWDIVDSKDEDYSFETLKPEPQLTVNPRKTQFQPVNELTATSTSIGTNDETIKDVADSSRSILDSIYHGDILFLNLTSRRTLPYYTESNFSSWSYSSITLIAKRGNDMSLLTKAFSGKTITQFSSNICSDYYTMCKVYENIKDKQFKSFYLTNTHDECARIFIYRLSKTTSFWSEMEHFSIRKFSKSQIVHTLNILGEVNSTIASSSTSNSKSLKLKSLFITIEDSDDEKIGELEIPSVEKLELKVINCDCKKEIEDFLPVFPNLKHLDIYVEGDFEPFKIKNNKKLKTLSISCTTEANYEFLEYLKEETSLSSFKYGFSSDDEIYWNRVSSNKK